LVNLKAAVPVDQKVQPSVIEGSPASAAPSASRAHTHRYFATKHSPVAINTPNLPYAATAALAVDSVTVAATLPYRSVNISALWAAKSIQLMYLGSSLPPHLSKQLRAV